MYDTFIMSNYNEKWSAYLRKLVLSIIILRGALCLNLKASLFNIIWILIIPFVLEGTAISITLNLIVPNMNWIMGFAVGFMLSAGSPAILVKSTYFIVIINC